jgi:uncharacterized membrane protein (GlpM family)
MTRRPDRLLALAGVAAGGAVLGHLLAYLAVFPAALERHAHLASTGHGSFPSIVRAGLVTLVLAIAVIAARSLRTAGGLDRRRATIVLGVLQVAGFAVLELAERGFSFAQAAGDPAVVLGLAIQAVLAVVAAIALSGLVHAVRAIAARPRRRLPLAIAGLLSLRPSSMPDRPAGSSRTRRRAPPLRLPS